MKAKLKTIFGVSVLSLLLTVAPVAVLAHEGEEHTEAETAQATTVENTDSTPKTQEELTAELKARLEERKAALKTKVDAAKQARIKTRCKASQGKLSSISGRIKGLETSRTQVYENVINRLTSLSEKLAAKGLDVATLNEHIETLKTDVATFNTDLAAYKEAVADLAEMDCAADPTAFQASLEAARAARAKVAEDAGVIRTLLKETIKQTLSDLRSQLEKSERPNIESGDADEAKPEEDQ